MAFSHRREIRIPTPGDLISQQPWSLFLSLLGSLVENKGESEYDYQTAQMVKTTRSAACQLLGALGRAKLESDRSLRGLVSMRFKPTIRYLEITKLVLQGPGAHYHPGRCGDEGRCKLSPTSHRLKISILTGIPQSQRQHDVQTLVHFTSIPKITL
jgi:hypothetical protein